MHINEQLNLDKSLYYLEQFTNVRLKQCYDNVFDNFTYLRKLVTKGHNVQVIYCYMQLYNNKYCRHVAFILDGELVDVTYALLYQKHKLETLPSYIELERFSLEDYINALRIDLNTDLGKSLGKKSLEMTIEYAKQGIMLIN